MSSIAIDIAPDMYDCLKTRARESGKAARLGDMERVAFLMNLHRLNVPVLDLDDEEIEEECAMPAEGDPVVDAL